MRLDLGGTVVSATGSLPTGVTLSRTGMLAGTATKAGTYTSVSTVRAPDGTLRHRTVKITVPARSVVPRATPIPSPIPTPVPVPTPAPAGPVLPFTGLAIPLVPAVGISLALIVLGAMLPGPGRRGRRRG